MGGNPDETLHLVRQDPLTGACAGCGGGTRQALLAGFPMACCDVCDGVWLHGDLVAKLPSGPPPPTPLQMAPPPPAAMPAPMPNPVPAPVQEDAPVSEATHAPPDPSLYAAPALSSPPPPSPPPSTRSPFPDGLANASKNQRIVAGVVVAAVLLVALQVIRGYFPSTTEVNDPALNVAATMAGSHDEKSRQLPVDHLNVQTTLTLKGHRSAFADVEQWVMVSDIPDGLDDRGSAFPPVCLAISFAIADDIEGKLHDGATQQFRDDKAMQHAFGDQRSFFRVTSKSGVWARIACVADWGEQRVYVVTSEHDGPRHTEADAVERLFKSFRLIDGAGE